MADDGKYQFYGDRPLRAVQFIYRRLALALTDGSQSREAAIAFALRELAGNDPELRRIKFFLPAYLKKLLTPPELAQLEAEMAPGRRRAERLKMVYPLSADEVSLEPDFLRAVLDFGHGPTVPRGGRFFTVGSCFAVNIAEFLSAHGYDAGSFMLSEDLNSPISNAYIFDIVRRPPDARVEAMAAGVGLIYPQFDEDQRRQVAELKLNRISQLAAELARADCVVMTLGNVIDFFRDDADRALPLVERVFPKYLAMAAQGDLDGNDNAAQRLKAQGATARMATHAESCEAIAACVAGIRAITAAPIVVTLSPVPIDAAVGLARTELRSALEVDCVSKSRLRSAYDEIAGELAAAHGPISYFPSYEIVRWLAPMLSLPTFGKEDAAARHVSGDILRAVCNQFVGDFVRWTEALDEGAPAGAA